MTTVEKCLISISKAKKLKNLNIFINECFETASKQAELSEKRLNDNGNVHSHSRRNLIKDIDKTMFILKKIAANSKLDGCLFTVKDNFCTKSIPTTCGSKMLENYIPPYNATVVERLANAGSIILGKTNMDEFGMGSVSSSYFATVKNPVNLSINKPGLDSNSNDFFISGGSSGGAAASVSSGLVQL